MLNCTCGRIARVAGMCYACYLKKHRQLNPEKEKKRSKNDYAKYREKHFLERVLRAFFFRLDSITGDAHGGERVWIADYTCAKCHKQKRGYRTFINNLPHCLSCKHQIEDRKKADEILKYSQAQNVIDTIDPIDKMRDECTKLGTCDILHFHHELLKGDPERLKTDFLINLICGEEKMNKYISKKDAHESVASV